jgi:hypothetical protein
MQGYSLIPAIWKRVLYKLQGSFYCENNKVLRNEVARVIIFGFQDKLVLSIKRTAAAYYKLRRSLLFTP